ncbi:MAG: peptidylprolyl isomerase, partial [Spirochaetales bacterium]|nr:peptidylprolyl isomerase [Spirochaetales bacterium]
MELYGKHSPLTVLNFIDLAQQGYYNEKTFHRVVSNFVIQAGCPRGDGYGSGDFVIRSELSPMRYTDEGYIGMASAGKHT